MHRLRPRVYLRHPLILYRTEPEAWIDARSNIFLTADSPSKSSFGIQENATLFHLVVDVIIQSSCGEQQLARPLKESSMPHT